MRPMCLLLTGAVVVGAAPLLTAQTVPLPTLPSETKEEPSSTPPPEEKPEAPPAEAGSPPRVPRREPITQSTAEGARRPQPWEYSVGAGVAWDSNIDFLKPDGEGGAAFVPQANLARIFSSSRGQLRTQVAGSWIGYRPPTQSRSYLDVGLRGEIRSSAHTKWEGEGHYGRGYTDASTTLVEQGVPLPLIKTTTVTGEVGLSQQVASRTFVRVEGRVFHSGFDDPALVNSTSLRGTVSLVRQLGARDSASLAYAVEDYLSGDEGSSSVTHFGSIQWQRTLSPRSALLLEGGGSYTPNAAQVGLNQSTGFFGGATFMRQIGRSNVTAFLRREVTPAFGLGVSRQETRLGLVTDVPVGRRWGLRVRAYHIQPQVPEGAGAAYVSSTDALVGLDRRVGRWVTVTGQGRYRRRGETEVLPAVSAFQASLFVSVGSSKQ
jgi:hypothetical protein